MDSRFLTYIEKLLERTRQGAIRWHETADNDAFRVYFAKGVIRVQKRRNLYQATLLDRDGRELESEIVNLEDDGWGSRLVYELFEVARRTALNIDNILDSMEQDLEEGKTVDPDPDPDPGPPPAGDPFGRGPDDDIPF